MRRCAVIGSPIQHSMSPLLHQAAYNQLGIASDYQYDRFEVTPETLDDFLAGLDENWVGLSVTAPNKQALLAHGICDEIATTLQSGNTIIFGRNGEPNRIYNTDVTGLLGALKRSNITKVERVILVGAGATARSALWAVAQLGAEEVLVLARNPQRATDSLGQLATDLGVVLHLGPLETSNTLPSGWPGADLLISTVPAELNTDLVNHLVKISAAVFEVVYNHYPSAFDQAAIRAGKPHLDGLDLLVGQALDQIKLMTGRDADPEPLLELCRAEVLRRG